MRADQRVGRQSLGPPPAPPPPLLSERRRRCHFLCAGLGPAMKRAATMAVLVMLAVRWEPLVVVLVAAHRAARWRVTFLPLCVPPAWPQLPPAWAGHWPHAARPSSHRHPCRFTSSNRLTHFRRPSPSQRRRGCHTSLVCGVGRPPEGGHPALPPRLQQPGSHHCRGRGQCRCDV